MGRVYADIEIINGGDLELVRRGNMDRDEVRRIWVNILVDSGSFMLSINEHMKELLQLSVISKRRSQLADGSVVEYEVVGPLEVRFKRRESICSALVLPGDSEPLLGMIPLEEMDVMIDPLRQELVVNPAHPEYALMKLKKTLQKPDHPVSTQAKARSSKNLPWTVNRVSPPFLKTKGRSSQPPVPETIGPLS